ncbi:hypothetical protein UFOVP99_37 [uncultured Caudovirales phage]|uniref:Uncharacterized protein n=1 Tax=uncultured Caudovirales phage TaxID=2100421 RepID=A0A6J5L5B3_9CAUD|nr:hypothetical protein UFOVP99_37 [uncultured Caudovirales phage]
MSKAPRIRRPVPTTSEVIQALEAAHVAMMHAAGMLAMRYGTGSQQAVQMAGAAAMVADDWIPGFRQEAMPA